jgi:SAM-dependent methyltransferase
VGNPYYYTHPGLLAAYGALYGLCPADPVQCRVLELGCGDGNNLIPMAYEFSESRFIGIDLCNTMLKVTAGGNSVNDMQPRFFGKTLRDFPTAHPDCTR